MVSKAKKSSPLFPIFFTVFLDLLGIGIVIPILAFIFLDPQHGVLPESYTASTRTVLLGLLIASYAVGQFFGAPIFGGLSDRFGRKRMLVFSIAGGAIGYSCFALAVVGGNVPLLFASRLLSGFMAGNLAIAMSAIADVSDQKEKAKNFGLIGMAFGLGFIIGPYVGGKLADNTVVSWFNYATPFWFAALLGCANILLILWKFQETLHTRTHVPISLLTGFRNIRRAFHLRNVRTLFLVAFLLMFGFTFYSQFFQVFLYEKFHYTESQVGNTFAYVGLWLAFSQGVITRFFSSKFSPQQILPVSLIVLSAVFPVISTVSRANLLYFVLPFVAIFFGLSNPNLSSLVSGTAGKESQGEILGIQQSIQAAATAIPPVISGFIYTINSSLPLYVAGICILASWAVFTFGFKKAKPETFHEIQDPKVR